LTEGDKTKRKEESAIKKQKRDNEVNASGKTTDMREKKNTTESPVAERGVESKLPVMKSCPAKARYPLREKENHKKKNGRRKGGSRGIPGGRKREKRGKRSAERERSILGGKCCQEDTREVRRWGTYCEERGFAEAK